MQVATSKPAQKAYLGTLLFAIASCILIAVSTVAYALFYYNYIPQIGVERVIHLQFGYAQVCVGGSINWTEIAEDSVEMGFPMALPLLTLLWCQINHTTSRSICTYLERRPISQLATSCSMPNSSLHL